MATEPTAQEQYMLELINNARLNPQAVASSLGVDLNSGLAAGTITTSSKAPLAFNSDLIDAATDHSDWMVANNTLSHTGAGGSLPTERIIDSGYKLTAPWSTGENIAWSALSSTSVAAQTAATQTMFDNLFASTYHRYNILYSTFKEVGIGNDIGTITTSGTSKLAMVQTQDFAASGATLYLTGVAYTDSDSNDFYTPGEGSGGVSLDLDGSTTTTWASGGYTLAFTGAGSKTLAFGGTSMRIELTSENAKVDLVDGNTVNTSVSLTILSGIADATLLGTDSLNLTGNNGGNALTGNSGINTLTGNGGADLLNGMGGNDWLYGGDGNDTLIGGTGTNTYNGGDGFDYASYVSGTSAVKANLTTGTATATGVADNFTSIEGLIGSGYTDTLTGNNAANELWGGANNVRDFLNGGAGKDSLYGQDGNDVLTGGADGDLLTGGAGKDKFVFDSSVGWDTVTDFVSGTDSLSFTASAYSGMSAGAFQLVINSNPTTTTQTFIYNTSNNMLYFDPDGSGSTVKYAVAKLEGVSVLKVTDITIS